MEDRIGRGGGRRRGPVEEADLEADLEEGPGGDGTADRVEERAEDPPAGGGAETAEGTGIRQDDDGRVTLDGDGPADYSAVPEGTYLCRITDVREGRTRKDDVRWGLKLTVDEGEFVGRLAAWDGLVFSHRGQTRVRRILGALGLPSQGRISIHPQELLDRRALVEVRKVEFVHTETGRVERRMEVPYDGYMPVDGDARGRQATRGDDDGPSPAATLPF